MSLFGGTEFYWTNAPRQINKHEEIRRFIDSVHRNALVVIKEHDEFTLDMIFNEPKHLEGEDIEMTCIYARHDLDKIGKKFVAPYENLMSYRSAMQERDFMELGDLVVGLPSSGGYHVTSHEAMFIGKVMLEDDYENDGSQIATRRWGDIYGTLSTIHSTEGEPGETHRVELNHFVPTHNPGEHLKNAGDIYSHIGVAGEIEGLTQGVIYPISGLSLNGLNDLQVSVDGFSNTVPFNFDGMRLFRKGELV